MENACHFILKALFVLKTIKLLSLIFGHIKNDLTRKIKLISEFMMSQPGKQTITIHILPNISRSKRKKTMEFGQVIEYNKRNIFPKKS